MALTYSEKRLITSPLRTGTRSSRMRRLQVYAVLTGFLSTLVSLVSLLVQVAKR